MAPATAGPLEDGLAALEAGDNAEAVKWFRLSDDAHAQFNLGYMYENGQGVSQDYVEALKWFRLSAEQGNFIAQNKLGRMYDNGQGVPQDYAQALKWYRLAAEQGYVPAQSTLGIIYLNGKGVPQDYVQAHMWFNLVAAQGNAGASTVAELRENLAARMTPAQIAEAQQLAREWIAAHPR